MKLPQSYILTGLVLKTLGESQRKTGPVLNSAPSETEGSETKYSETEGSDFLIEDEEERLTGR